MNFSDTEEKHWPSWTFKWSQTLSWWERKSTKLLTLIVHIIDVFCFSFLPTELEAAKLEWGNSDQLGQILKKHNDGFDLILGADIYILMFVNEFFIYPLGQWLILVLSVVEVLVRIFCSVFIS